MRTKQSIVDLTQRCAEGGYAVERAGLVVRSVIDPDSIANPLIRAHAPEFALLLNEFGD